MTSQLMDNVMQFANNDQRVSSVILRGSRANPNALVDEDSDYDVLYGVNDLQSFQMSDEWLSVFGDCLIMQKPESMLSELISQTAVKEVYLMQFKDGTRLDLVVIKEGLVQTEIDADSLSVILLDKTGMLVAGEPNKSSYVNELFNLDECVNEFLWLSFYVVKGARRKQLMYTQDHLGMMRTSFMTLLAHQYDGNAGAHFKNSEKVMNAYELSRYKDTFGNDIPNSLKILFDLFESYLKKEDFDRTQFDDVRYVIETQISNL